MHQLCSLPQLHWIRISYRMLQLQILFGMFEISIKKLDCGENFQFRTDFKAKPGISGLSLKKLTL